MVITAPDDVRPVLKSYANKYIPKAFADYQEELRKQFNEEHRQKMAHLHLKSKFYFLLFFIIIIIIISIISKIK